MQEADPRYDGEAQPGANQQMDSGLTFLFRSLPSFQSI